MALKVVMTLLDFAVHNAWAAACEEACNARSRDKVGKLCSAMGAWEKWRLRRRTGSRLVTAAAETVTPVATVSGDWEIFRISIAASLDDHRGLRL